LKILVRRTGGFAGLEYNKEIDTAQMDAAEARNIEQMVENMRFFDLPAMLSDDTITADAFHYEITVIKDDRQHTVSLDSGNGSQSSPLSKLINFLKI
jgi:hypothetical protein